MKTENVQLSPVKVGRIKKMEEILSRAYMMQVARSFWRIDRVEEERGVDDASFYYAQQVENNLKGYCTPDQSTRVPNTSSKAGRDTTGLKGSRGELPYTINYADHTLTTPKVNKKNARQTSPSRR